MSAGRDSPAGTSLRLFVAIELPADLKRALEDAIAMLKRAGADEGLRWVRPEGIHLTLKFLGVTPPARVPAITSALREHLAGAMPFDVQPEGLGAFYGGKHMHRKREWGHREPHPHNIRIIWVGFDESETRIVQLTSRVEAALIPLGFPTEKAPFFPHLTLARVRDDADIETRRGIARVLSTYQTKAVIHGKVRRDLVPQFPPLRVESVSLMQSTLKPGGAVYQALQTFTLDA